MFFSNNELNCLLKNISQLVTCGKINKLGRFCHSLLLFFFLSLSFRVLSRRIISKASIPVLLTDHRISFLAISDSK